MGLLKHFRSRSRLKTRNAQPTAATYGQSALPTRSGARWGRDFSQRLPDEVLSRIFTYVCPHVTDTSYEPSESSQIGEGCMLCDLRDLAQSAQVCRKWYRVAQILLYTSVRIDAVHYCALEDILAEKRKKQAKHLRKGSRIEPGEVPNIRLSLLSRTVKENPRLGDEVLYLKLPYMTRETAKGDLARTVSVLPNLRYVDLPEGFYSADSSCLPLRQEVQGRCLQIRKMTYRPGSEDELPLHMQGYWRSIETLELNGLAVEHQVVRMVLASLPQLRELTLANLEWVEDAMFEPFPNHLPDFPPLHLLKIENIPKMTASGLKEWLQAPEVRAQLYSLTLTNTGVPIPDLHSILWAASGLHHLSISVTVSKSLLLQHQELPPLTSISLKTLHFEIVSSDDVHTLQKPSESYYAYLASSLHGNAMPALKTLYVRDQGFPELLLLPPMPQRFPNGGSSDQQSLRSKPSNPSSTTGTTGVGPMAGGGSSFNQTLEVFSKGIDELEWVFTHVTPPSQTRDRRGSATGGRPLSAYSASKGLGPQWAQGGFGGEARKSVMVGNGFGGFLAVPADEVPRPRTSDGALTNGSTGMISSMASQHSGGSHKSSHSGSDGSLLQPPPGIGALTTKRERRGSRHDLWR